MDYNSKTLDELCNVKIGRTPPRNQSEWFNSGASDDWKWVSIKDMGNCGKFITTTSETITDKAKEAFNYATVASGTILLSFKLTLGRVVICDGEFVTNEAIAQLPIKDPSTIDRDYLYYYLKNYNWSNIGSTSSIATAVNSKMVKGIKIDFPDLETQKKIVRILSALDQKIELNNQQSKVLETAAFTLYDDLINNIDESNFKEVAIGQIADCKLGGTPSRAKTEYWGGSINWINSGAINSFRITGPSELITEEGFKHTSTYMLPKGTTVLAITGATLGQVSRMEIEGCANQSVIGIVGNNVISNEYIYLTIVRNIQEIINRQTGGAQQHINKNDIKEFEIILPNQQLMNDFTNKVRPFFEKIAQNEFENKTLSSLRDAILPELMSGEINLNEITINE